MPTVAWLLLCFSTAHADWKPAPGPLATRWGKQVTPQNVHTEYPRPQMVRSEWVNLNGLWNYAIVGRPNNSNEYSQPKSSDGEILVPFPIESSLSGVGKRVLPEQRLWYRRTFRSPKLADGGRLLLHFGAVDWEATVFVNDTKAGEHRGGYSPFTLDITDALKPGDAEQVLTVAVWDPTDAGAQPRGKQVHEPRGIWYTAVTGIWQTVWLESVPAVSILGLTVLPDADRGVIRVAAALRGQAKQARLRVAVLSDKKVVARQTGETESVEVAIPQPELWSPDQPTLYDLKVTLLDGEKLLDEVDSYCALRKIEFRQAADGFNRLLLNNRPLFQYGPLDQGWWPDGLYTPPSDAALEADVQTMKDVGFNMVRKHVKVEPARFYYHCDRLGLLVWQDMPSAMQRGKPHGVRVGQANDVAFSAEEVQQFRVELKEMIDSLRHFPSIVVWVPFNEGWGQHNTNDILRWTAEYDPTRLVDGPSGWEDRGYGHLKDLHRYPGPDMFAPISNRVSVLGEFGGLGWPIEGHLWQQKANWGYRTYQSQAELRENYRQLMLQLRELIGKGLAAAVYTQLTDVEIEVNGLLTYDREVLKLDQKELAAWHKSLHGPPPIIHDLVATSQKQPQTWRYTTGKPSENWFVPDFDDASWQSGPGGFGTSQTPGTVVRTEWKTPDVWIRRSFDLAQLPQGDVLLRIHHDEDAEVYLNGVLAAKLTGYVTFYKLATLSEAARAALHPGRNVLAIRCRQTGGGQYIDAGLITLEEPKAAGP